MAESLINVKRRINTIKSTQKITKAMKLVASVKFQRFKKYLADDKPYAQGMKEVLEQVLQTTGLEAAKKSECFVHHSGTKNLYVIVSSTLGLCGAYNYSLFKEVDPLLKEGDELFLIGQKAVSHYMNTSYAKDDSFAGLLDQLTYSKVRRLRHVLLQKYRTGEYQAIYLVYTHYKNSIVFLPTVEKIVPFEEETFASLETPLETAEHDESKEELLNTFVPRYIDSYLYERMLESELSEISSRRNAMESATDSAEKIVRQLMITYNKTRQNAITQEITEVVAGATAGNKKDEE